MIESFIKLFTVGLQLWDDKEKNKYVDKLLSLKESYYAEYNKPIENRSDAVLDNIRFELRILGDAFSSNAIRKNT